MNQATVTTSWRAPLSGLLALLAFSVLALSCRQIVGIGPDFNVSNSGASGVGADDNAGASGSGDSVPASPLCERYCNTVTNNCTGANSAYASRQACLGICALLPAGDAAKPNYTNTVSCRMSSAEAAAQLAPSANCAAAGPGGNGVCGSNCESYCLIEQSICPTDEGLGFTPERCIETCPAWTDGTNTQATIDSQDDTIACRLAYLSRASADDRLGRAEACQSATLRSAVCVDDPSKAPTCEALCRFARITCQDEQQVYEDLDQCMATCQALDAGTNGDVTENTVGCRLYHAHNAAVDPRAHCAHAGPGGDGHCGDTETGNCDSLCQILRRGCGAKFTAAYDDDESACRSECAALSGAAKDSRYSVVEGQGGGDTFACRLLHAVRSLTDDGASCVAAFGGPPCADP